MYLTTGTRPDLAHTISFLSQYSSCPNESHLNALKHILRYLNGTKHLSLFYPANNSTAINTYVDADFAACLDTRQSFSGYVVLINESCVSWRSKKQASVATSTTEAEYMAMSLATRQIQWFRTGLLDFRIQAPIAMHADNTGAIFLSTNHQLNERTKHIDVHFYQIREEIDKGTFTL